MAVIIFAGFFLQYGVFANLLVIDTVPNILLIITVSFGFMKGKTQGMVIGLFCGLLMDIIMFAGIIALIVLAVKGVFRLYTRSLYLSGKDMLKTALSPLFIAGAAVMVVEMFI